MLLSGNNTLEAAYSTGYETSSYFGQSFKELYVRFLVPLNGSYRYPFSAPSLKRS
jgi:hypothetical protein